MYCAERNNVPTYLCHSFMRPDTHSQAVAIHDSCCTNTWNQNQTHSVDPRQCHTHFGHPVTIVLAVSDGMDDLEVAFQGDDHETSYLRGYSNCCQCCTFKEHANCAVKYVVTNVNLTVIGLIVLDELMDLSQLQVFDFTGLCLILY